MERSEPEVAIVDLNYQRSTDWRWRVDYARATASALGCRQHSFAAQRRGPFQNGSRWLRRRAHQAHRSTGFSRQFSTVAAHRIDNRVEALTGYPCGGNAWVSFGHYLPSRTLHSRKRNLWLTSHSAFIDQAPRGIRRAVLPQSGHCTTRRRQRCPGSIHPAAEPHAAGGPPLVMCPSLLRLRVISSGLRDTGKGASEFSVSLL